MGDQLIHLTFPGVQRMVDFVWLHAKYYELYLRCHAIMQYADAQSRNSELSMSQWRRALESSAEELLNPRHEIHSYVVCIVHDVQHTESWQETIELFGSAGQLAAELYRRWSKCLKTLMTEGKTGIQNQLTEEAESRFRHDLLHAAKESVQVAREVAGIKDPALREGVAVSLSGLMRELDESFGRTKAWLTARGKQRGSVDDVHAIDPTSPDQSLAPDGRKRVGDGRAN